MRAKIETYRGIDIEFDTCNEKFNCVISEGIKLEKGSYKLMQEAIDKYLKDNQSFKPFKVTNKPTTLFGGVGEGVCTVIGIRKDGRFVYENKEKKKQQIADHYERDIILYEPEMEVQLVEIAYLETLVDDARKKVEEAKKKVKGITLAEYRKNLKP